VKLSGEFVKVDAMVSIPRIFDEKIWNFFMINFMTNLQFFFIFSAQNLSRFKALELASFFSYQCSTALPQVFMHL
jgi:hypothetical protein